MDGGGAPVLMGCRTWTPSPKSNQLDNCGRSLQEKKAPATRIFSPLAVAGLCVSIGRYWYLFKRLTAVSASRFYRFEHIETYSCGKVSEPLVSLLKPVTAHANVTVFAVVVHATVRRSLPLLALAPQTFDLTFWAKVDSDVRSITT